MEGSGQRCPTGAEPLLDEGDQPPVELVASRNLRGQHTPEVASAEVSRPNEQRSSVIVRAGIEKVQHHFEGGVGDRAIQQLPDQSCPLLRVQLPLGGQVTVRLVHPVAGSGQDQEIDVGDTVPAELGLGLPDLPDHLADPRSAWPPAARAQP